MTLVSIIIPFYNVELYIEKCIQSAINQTFKDIEIICVDDFSKDNSLKIVEKYAKLDDRIKIIRHKENKRQGAARNTGLNVAKGQYVMFLDSDDWLEEDAIEYAYNQIHKNSNDFVYFAMNLYDEDTKTSHPDFQRLEAFKGHFHNPKIKFSELKRPYMAFCESCNRIYKKSFLDKYNIRYPEHLYYEDQPFIFKALLYANNVSILDRPIYNYRIRHNSTTWKVKGFDDLLYVRKYILEKLNKSDAVDENFMNNYLISCMWSVVNCFKRFSKLDKKYEKHMYEGLRDFLTLLDKNYNLDNIKNYFDYKFVKKVIKNDYKSYKFKIFIKSLFNIYNETTSLYQYKILNILGFGIILKRKDRQFKF